MVKQGSLVEYVEQGRFLCAFVLEDNNNRLRVLNQNGREVVLPCSRLVHQSSVVHRTDSTREEMQKQLKAADQCRNELSDAIDLPEIWELASSGPEDSFAPEFLAALAFGNEPDDDHVAGLLRAVFSDRLFFKYREGRVVAHPPEVVEQLRLRAEKEQKQESLLTSGARALQALVAGAALDDWPDRDECLRLVRDHYLSGAEAPDDALARELLKRAGLTRPHDSYFVLIKAGIWEKHENIPLLRYNVPRFFSEENEREAAAAAVDTAPLEVRGRRDLTALPVLSIDGPLTRDFDDALHIERRGENFLVGIHIADVAAYVAPESALFYEARQRASSIYFPDSQVPMLPKSLSEGACSLVAGSPRPAMSFLVLLSPGGEVIESEIVMSIVEVKRQLTYQQAEELLGKDKDLADLAMLSRKLQALRIAAGALLLPIPDVNITVGDDERISVSVDDADTPSRTLVAEFMVLANMVGASFVADREAAGLFRCQGPPHQRLVTQPQKDLLLNFRQRKQLKPGELLTSPQLHSGVGTSAYTTVTSPIRRFLDLVMQHQIASLIRGKGARFGRPDMQNFSADIQTALTRVNLVRRLRHRYWLLRYLEPKVGQRVDALLLEKGPKRVTVVLLDCLLECELPPNQAVGAKPGAEIKVLIDKVQPLDNTLRLAW